MDKEFLSHWANMANEMQKPLKAMVELNMSTLDNFKHLKAADLHDLRKTEQLLEQQVKLVMDNSHKMLDYMQRSFNILGLSFAGASKDLKANSQKAISEVKKEVKKVVSVLSKPVAKKAAAKKSVAKKVVAKKAVAAKKAVVAKKAVAAKKSVVAKKAVAAKKSVIAKKAVAAKKSIVAKKAVAAKKSVIAKKAVAAKKSIVAKKAIAAKKPVVAKKAIAAKKSIIAKKAIVAKKPAAKMSAKPAVKHVVKPSVPHVKHGLMNNSLGLPKDKLNHMSSHKMAMPENKPVVPGLKISGFAPKPNSPGRN